VEKLTLFIEYRPGKKEDKSSLKVFDKGVIVLYGSGLLYLSYQLPRRAGSILTYQRQNHQNLSDFFIVLKEKMLQQRH